MFTVHNYNIYPDLFYDPKEHFWLKAEGKRARIGMDPLVQDSMGAFVVVQLDPVGKLMSKGDSFGTVEAEKYVGPFRSPVSGIIVAVNEQVVQNPRLTNAEPYGNGWLIEMELTDFEKEKDGLLTGEEPVRKWFEHEIQRYQEKEWLAES